MFELVNSLEPQQISSPFPFEKGIAEFLVCKRIKFVMESGTLTAELGPVYEPEQNSLDLSSYDQFRKLTFTIQDQNFDSYAAFQQDKNKLGFLQREVCLSRLCLQVMIKINQAR